MNSLYVGLKQNIQLPKSGYLYINDEVPQIPRARLFDPRKHSFNPLKNINYKRAREITEILYTLSPQGQDTLTVRDGKRALLKVLLKTKRLNKLKADAEVSAMIEDLLVSPVLNKVFCSDDFSFNPNSIILARINRSELGQHDALTLGLMLIARFEGQIVLPDFGFYGRPIHSNLIHENRLIAGIRYLDQVPLPLKKALLLIEEKIPQKALYDDACLLAQHAGLRPDFLREDNPFNRFVDAAMQA